MESLQPVPCAETEPRTGDRPTPGCRASALSLTAPVVAGPALLAAAIAVAYGHTLTQLARQWATDGDYSHGFVVVPLAMFFAWRRRERLRRAPVRPNAAGLVGVLAALVLLVVGQSAADVFLPRLSVVLLIASTVLFVYGVAYARILALPLAFLLFMVPLPAIVFNEIAFPLQQVASMVGETALRAANVPVLREGNILELASVRLEVAEACSGIRSLMTLLTFAVVLGEMGGPSRKRMVLLVAATFPVAIVANAVRVAATGFAAQFWGAAVVEGVLHAAAGSIIFVVAVAALVALDRGVRRYPRDEALSC